MTWLFSESDEKLLNDNADIIETGTPSQIAYFCMNNYRRFSHDWVYYLVLFCIYRNFKLNYSYVPPKNSIVELDLGESGVLPLFSKISGEGGDPMRVLEYYLLDNKRYSPELVKNILKIIDIKDGN